MTESVSVRVQALQKSFWDESRGEVRAVDGIDFECHQGEIFGLYATTGRVASFLSPAMWTVFIAAFGSTIFGVLGIGLVLLLGLILLLFVRLPKRSAA